MKVGLMKVRIPAHGDHAFHLNVNADSSKT
jgi:hypothetical protein